MRVYLALVAISLSAGSWACESDEDTTTPPNDGGGTADVTAADAPAPDVGTVDAVSTDSTAGLSWFSTCGDPVCSGYSAPDPPLDMCSDVSANAGETCGMEGQQCDPMDPCNARLICAQDDPKSGPGGCPISRMAFKTDITYVSPTERDALAKELLAMPLARWRYLHEGAETPAHLGFIIEDVEPSHAVQSRRDRVDLYGFTTMAVATIQTQQRHIEALEQKLKRLESLVVSGN